VIPADIEHTVYIAYSEDGDCLYVGCSVDAEQRIASHRSTSEWWPYAYRYEYLYAPTRAEGFALERATIARLRPLFNQRGNPEPVADPLSRVSHLPRKGSDEAVRAALQRLVDLLTA
jgi:hypothetical protein